MTGTRCDMIQGTGYGLDKEVSKLKENNSF